MAVNDILGADVETGGVWDPLGFSKVRKSTAVARLKKGVSSVQCDICCLLV